MKTEKHVLGMIPLLNIILLVDKYRYVWFQIMCFI
jgi:hypothetical protein